MLPHLHAVCQDFPALQPQKSKQDIHHRRLSRTGGSHNPNRFPHRYFHVGMVKDQHLRVRVLIHDVLKLYFFFDFELIYFRLLFIGIFIIINALIRDFLLQVVTDSHKEGFKIGNRSQMVVDSVGAGNQPHCCHSKGCNLRNDL